ncbi:AsnC family transcriptional regulator [Natrinema sp. CBA1119]|jgi:Lrp/AsnC family transcriptional regulator for asnA, asnC and gidA|uniref:Lrp/AsnC family transcriptional regulator n=1 Tax=unclassified Natrinema TaxID=2622230 RepID=UPI000BF3F549|nr:Lrp/AsnC ligand binding domain-containing protein [Natrinema sp. CBA1119]PGF16150.1 AsnC family transcriptional regulator [Natrinema sp. CBA1119]
MVDAYTMIDTATGTAEGVCQALCDAEGVIDAHVIAGDFDVMVEIAGDDSHDILETITDTVRPLEGVGTTRTYICLD